MMSFNNVGHMAAEVELEDQSTKRQNIRPKQILFTAIHRVNRICGGLLSQETELSEIQYCTDAHARMETDLMDSEGEMTSLLIF